MHDQKRSFMLGWAVAVFLGLGATPVIGTVFAQAPDGATGGRQRLYDFTEVTMSLFRSACYGQCPVYEIEIRGDGSGTYKGSKYVADIGPHSLHLPRPEVLRLLSAFLRVRFFELLDKYDEFATVVPQGEGKFAIVNSTESDLSTAVLRLRIAGRTKTIVLRENYPSDLGELAKLFDEVSGSSAWIRGASK